MSLVRVVLSVCDLCLRDRTDGREEECHVPGCAFWMDDAPEGRMLTLLRSGIAKPSA